MDSDFFLMLYWIWKMKIFEDQLIAQIDDFELKCDITVPESETPPPLVIWIHGGGWRNGSYKNNRISWITEYGFACASIGYRLTDRAIFPAQLHDCKGGIRWLRAHAAEFGFDPERFAVSGGSAGGYLAMMIGVSADIPELEGDIAGNTDVSSAVSAVVNYWGPSDFILRTKTQPDTYNSPSRGSFELLDGKRLGHIDMELARIASPVHYVTSDSPPMITFHGLADEIVLPDQAKRIDQVYREKGADHELVTLEGEGHGSHVLTQGEYREKAVDFLKKYL